MGKRLNRLTYFRNSRDQIRRGCARSFRVLTLPLLKSTERAMSDLRRSRHSLQQTPAAQGEKAWNAIASRQTSWHVSVGPRCLAMGCPSRKDDACGKAFRSDAAPFHHKRLPVADPGRASSRTRELFPLLPGGLARIGWGVRRYLAAFCSAPFCLLVMKLKQLQDTVAPR